MFLMVFALDRGSKHEPEKLQKQTPNGPRICPKALRGRSRRVPKDVLKKITRHPHTSSHNKSSCAVIAIMHRHCPYCLRVDLQTVGNTARMVVQDAFPKKRGRRKAAVPGRSWRGALKGRASASKRRAWFGTRSRPRAGASSRACAGRSDRGPSLGRLLRTCRDLVIGTFTST